MTLINPIKAATLCGALFAATAATAQMVGADIFLKGRYLEVGINTAGEYGPRTQPAGYHGNATGLGFVADIAMDGWTIGTPAYYGDYFLPGSPYEGWELQVGSSARCQAFNTTSGTFVFAGGMTGSGANASYTTSGSQLKSTWLGSFDSLNVKQETTLDTNNLYFSVKVTLTNISSLPKNDIYFLRTVDPDNDVMLAGGSFATNNTIEHQVTDTTVVSATGRIHSAAYMAMGTVDTNATCVIYDSWALPITVDLATIYNMSYGGATYADRATRNGDIAIGLEFKVAHLASIDSAGDSVAYRTTATSRMRRANEYSFTYFIAFTPTARDSAMSQLRFVPTLATLAVADINKQPEVRVYPNPMQNNCTVSGLNAADKLSLYDMMGRELPINWAAEQGGTQTYSTEGIAAGRYVLMVKDASGAVRSRSIIQKL